MKINRLLSLDLNLKCDQSLGENFGDSYLFQKNKIYANIRKEILRIGFTFTLERDLAYEVLPMSQLENILTKKQLPFSDSTQVLTDLDRRMKSEGVWDDVSDNLKRNYLFHESCHGVARHQINSLLGEKSHGAQFFGEREIVLRMLIEESFANTCELMALAEAEDSAHRIFLEANSYCRIFEERTNLKNAQNLLGASEFFQFLFYSYLFSNFLFEQIDEKSFKRITQIVSKNIESDSKKIKTLKAHSKIAFQLNPRFREVTTNFYLKLNDIKTSPGELFNFNFLEPFEKEAKYDLLIKKLTQLALRSN